MTIVLQSLCILQGKFLYVITSALLDMLHVAGVKTETLTLAKTAILNISASTFFFMEQKKTKPHQVSAMFEFGQRQCFS